MSSVSNEQIYETLVRVAGDIGELKANSNGTREWLAKHVAADEVAFRAVDADIRQLRTENDARRATMKAWGFIATAVATAAGIITNVVARLHH